MGSTLTTRNAISGGMLALIEHPAQRRRLLDDPSLLPSAVEEILRWTSPVMHMARTAARDVELHGQTVRQGERLILWYPSANRDRRCSRTPTGSTWAARRTIISPSVSASTSASGPASPGWSWAWVRPAAVQRRLGGRGVASTASRGKAAIVFVLREGRVAEVAIQGP